MASVKIKQLLAAAAEACDERKAEDIRILALDPSESGLADYFLICTGNSDRQNVAITDAIELKLKHEFGVYPESVEGRRLGEWILMDYFNFIVHVFSPEKRAFYGLERLRKSATHVSVEELNSNLREEMAQQIAPARQKSAAKKAGTSAAKKTAAKKAVAKKAVAKKAVAKKTAAKKTSAKKAGGETSVRRRPY